MRVIWRCFGHLKSLSECRRDWPPPSVRTIWRAWVFVAMNGTRGEAPYVAVVWHPRLGARSKSIVPPYIHGSHVRNGGYYALLCAGLKKYLTDKCWWNKGLGQLLDRRIGGFFGAHLCGKDHGVRSVGTTGPPKRRPGHPRDKNGSHPTLGDAAIDFRRGQPSHMLPRRTTPHGDERRVRGDSWRF